LYVLLSSSWAKTLVVGNKFNESLMLFMWIDCGVYAFLILTLECYKFDTTDQHKIKYQFIIMRHLIINGIEELIWSSREWRHVSYLIT
jgi:hypothetical protein